MVRLSCRGSPGQRYVWIRVQPHLERQSTARWAAAHLASAPSGDLGWALTVQALSTFVEIEEQELRSDLPLGRLRWSDRRIKELCDSAREWLDGQ